MNLDAVEDYTKPYHLCGARRGFGSLPSWQGNGIVMRSGLLALTFIATMSAGAAAASLEPVRAGQDSFIRRAVFADGRVWLLSDAGLLSAIADGKDDRIEMPLPEPALDLWLRGGRPAVITCRRNGCTDWTIREWIGGKWAVTAKVPTAGDRFMAMGSDGAGLTLLSSRRLIEVAGKTQRATVLSQHLPNDVITPKGVATSMHVAPTRILVGFNAGEWGGGVQRIDRRTGEVSDVARDVSNEPVNGIAAEPWKPDCMAVAIGVVHLEPHGSLVEVCGDAVSQLDVKPDRAGRTVAFFGLVRRGDNLWSAGTDGIYRIGSAGATQSAPLPSFKKVGGVSVSFDVPDFVIVLTHGSVLLLVPR
jgi:hypothetical protein